MEREKGGGPGKSRKGVKAHTTEIRALHLRKTRRTMSQRPARRNWQTVAVGPHLHQPDVEVHKRRARPPSIDNTSRAFPAQQRKTNRKNYVSVREVHSQHINNRSFRE